MSDEVWRDWLEVGSTFARIGGLTDEQRAALHRGETVKTDVVIRDGLLWGSIFRFDPNGRPRQLAGMFYDFEGQARYVPGMPVVRVVTRAGKRSRVFHRINPIVFLWPGADRFQSSWWFRAGMYSYELDEEVFEEPGGHSIRWTIPLAKQVLGGRENGEIMFTEHEGGALITYNNATAPFGYAQLKWLLPKRLLAWLYRSLGGIAQDYYRRTVDGVLRVAGELSAEQLEADEARLLEDLQGSR
ncbi:MAG: hypothetical protein GY898_20710 [Proteobacteria bacterium]|nr:hypothetical protein [Pseudomonadota bacterium]